MRDSIHKYFRMGTVRWMSHPPAFKQLLKTTKNVCGCAAGNGVGAKVLDRPCPRHIND
ncbi:MAG: hypothetical protein HFG74_03390 [Hungatella sp.]|nr:hypothetical protein [Hungatella sp.]